MLTGWIKGECIWEKTEYVRFVKSKPSQMNWKINLMHSLVANTKQDVNLIKQFISQYGSYTDELLMRINTLRTNLGSYPAAGIEVSKLDSIMELLGGYFSKNKVEMLIKEKEPAELFHLPKPLQR